VAGPVAVLENAALSVTTYGQASGLRPGKLDNRLAGGSRELRGEWFSLQMRDGTVLNASAMRVEGQLSCESLAGNAGAARASERYAGQALHAVLRDSGNYVRQELALEPAHWSADAAVPVSLKPFEVQVWDLQPLQRAPP
jgi:hypothetical protein